MYGKRMGSYGNCMGSVGKHMGSVGKHEGGVGKRFFIMFNFSFGIIGTIWVLLGNFEFF